MEQTKALNALEPFLLLARSATSPRAAADLITRATSHPHTYVFAELLAQPQIRALAGTPYASHLALLNIFAHGTYADYQLQAPILDLPRLDKPQAAKLRQLTLLTLASRRAAAAAGTLGYAALGAALDLASPRDLEALVTSAIYAGLVHATLDPKNRLVQVSGVSALRDLAPRNAPGMIHTLRAWAGRCDDALADIEAEIEQIRAAATRRAADKREWEAHMKQLVEHEDSAPAGGAGGGNAGSGGGGGGGGGGAGGSSSGAGGSSSTRKIAVGMGGPRTARYGKRGPGHMDGSLAAEGVGDDGAMELDDEEDETEGKKRASRRKL